MTTQNMKFSIEDFLSKCDQIRRKLRIWSYLLKKSLMANFIFCAVYEKQKILRRNTHPYTIICQIMNITILVGKDFCLTR